MSDVATILVCDDSIDVAVSIHATIPEFQHPADPKYFEERYCGKNPVILVAYREQTPIGYTIAYDKFGDGSLYCWMAGVHPMYRNLGALSALMNALEERARQRGAQILHIMTRNSRRAMLQYLVKHGYLFTDVQQRDDATDHRLTLLKPL